MRLFPVFLRFPYFDRGPLCQLAFVSIPTDNVMIFAHALASGFEWRIDFDTGGGFVHSVVILHRLCYVFFRNRNPPIS